MKTELAENIFTVANLLDADECRAMIDRGESQGFETAFIRSVRGVAVNTEVRNNDRAEIMDVHLAGRLWELCRPHVPTPWNGGEAIGLDEIFRFYRYDVGQRFKRHRDVRVLGGANIRSQLTLLVYLNDGFEGGETVFYREEDDGSFAETIRVAPRQGEALFFKHELWHEGFPLTSGRKYVLRSDVFYRFPPVTSA